VTESLRLELSNFAAPDLDEGFVEHLVREESLPRAIHFGRLWAYYRNDLSPLGAGLPEAHAGAEGDWAACLRPYTQAQEFGLPARITGRTHLGFGGTGVPLAAFRRKEVVIENDIGWRVDTGVHYLAGKAVGLESLTEDRATAERIESVLRAVWEASGGQACLQEMALLGAVYGFVDVVVRARNEEDDGPVEARAARAVTIEPVEAPRILPILEEDDYRRLRYWVQVFRKQVNRVSGRRRAGRPFGPVQPEAEEVETVEILGPRWWQRYEDGRLAAEGENPLGCVPVVHIQNLPHPYHYEGFGEVEPLIALQDELNTRLSDRANRVTFQSFKMYLGKGIDGFEDRPVAPGRMWATDNPDAAIEEFGGDADSPSEEVHVEELRQALDKVSGVTPLAAGLLRDNLGNLSSATALRVVLMGTLARLERKRLTYGAGLMEMNRMILEALDRLGIFHTRPEDRATRLHWPSPLPENLGEKLAEAKAKRDLGVPAETVLRELGYELK
jgi:hypothetical protein